MISRFSLPHSFIIFLSSEELHDQAFSFHRCVVSFHCTEGRRGSETERWKDWIHTGPVCKCMWTRAAVRLYICIRVPYISVMVSGRLVGISVSPFPLQSTMLLLQVQDSGHCNTLQEEEDDDDWWPAQRRGKSDPWVTVLFKGESNRIYCETDNRVTLSSQQENIWLKISAADLIRMYIFQCLGLKQSHAVEDDDLPSSQSWKAWVKDGKKKSKHDKDGFFWKVKQLADVRHETDKRGNRGDSTYLRTQTPSSAPPPRCAPSSEVGPCTEYRDPDGGAVAATPTARPRGSHTAGCWSAGGWERRLARGRRGDVEYEAIIGWGVVGMMGSGSRW